jgi:hypothetical protein
MHSPKFFLILTLFVLLFVVPEQVIGQQPYMGGYFYYSYFSSKRVLIEVHFDADYTQFPNGYWLAGVSSVAGASSGTTPSSWMYQNGVSLTRDNVVSWAPQSWKMDQKLYYMQQQVGSVSR